MTSRLRFRVLTAVVAAAAGLVAGPAVSETGPAGADPAHGVLAASVGDEVVLADPLGRWQRRFDTGPVAWLFPAPGGTLFAPDLVDGRTAVIDLASLVLADRIDGITMPWFGSAPDRYLAVTDELLVVSYPDRSILGRVPVTVRRPWQVVLAAHDTYAIVLERDPVGGGATELVIADLAEGRVTFRRGTGGDVVRFAVGPAGTLAFADAAASQLRLVRAATLETITAADLAGTPVDLVATGVDDEMMLAVSDADGGGSLSRWRVKRSKHGVRLVERKRRRLDHAPVRIAVSPAGDRVAVATADGFVTIHGTRDLDATTRIQIGGPPRDLDWCDPTTPGPALPMWSDHAPEGTIDPSRLERDGP